MGHASGLGGMGVAFHAVAPALARVRARCSDSCSFWLGACCMSEVHDTWDMHLQLRLGGARTVAMIVDRRLHRDRITTRAYRLVAT